MNHLTDLELSMLSDEALLPDQAALAADHLSSCASCRNRLADYVQEREILSASLKTMELEVPEIETPTFSKPITLKQFAIANVITGLILWLTQFLWKTLFGELVISAITELTTIYFPGAFEIFVDTMLYLTLEGTSMIESYLGLVVIVLAAAIVAWIAFSLRKSRLLVSLSLVVALSTGLVVPPPAAALEVRRDENMVSIESTETVNDTLIIMSETIIVDGNVTGDLVIMGRRIIVNGDVGGNLVTMGQAVTIEGSVGGTLISATDTLELMGSSIAWDLWSASSKTTIDEDSTVNGTAVVATELVTVEGQIARDLYAFCESVELSGTVGEDLEAFAANVRLLGDARVDGKLRARVDDEEDISQSASATVEGGVEFLSLPEELEPRNKYTSGDYYLGQLFRLVSAFIVGLVILWLIPAFRDESLEGGTEGLKTAGIGLLALVSAPVIVVLCAATVVGIPLALLGLIAWGAAVYLAKIIVAAMLGQLMLGATDYEDNLFLILLAGLVVVIAVTALPAIGGILNFILTIVGLGMIVRMAMALLAEEEAIE